MHVEITHVCDFYKHCPIFTRKVWFYTQNVIFTRRECDFYTRVCFWHTWVCDFYTHNAIWTQKQTHNVILSSTSVSSTPRVQNSHVDCDHYMKRVILSRKVWFSPTRVWFLNGWVWLWHSRVWFIHSRVVFQHAACDFHTHRYVLDYFITKHSFFLFLFLFFQPRTCWFKW
jgi:hypothetical protein